MIKILLLFLIFVDISSKTIPDLKYGIETPFNKNDYEFNIEPSDRNDIKLITYINIENKELELSLINEGVHGYYHSTRTTKYPGAGCIIRLLEGSNNYLNFTSLDGEDIKNGTIWIYPLDRSFKIDLSKNIDFKFPIIDLIIENEYFGYEFFVYSLEKVDQDEIVIFKYEKRIEEEYVGIIDLENPFMICQDDICKDKVNYYTFLKGKDYTIKLKLEYKNITVEGYNYNFVFLPAYSFNAIKPINLEYSNETPFNKNMNIFNINYNDKLGHLIMYVNTENKNLNITLYNKSNLLENYDSHAFKSPGGVYIFIPDKIDDTILIINSLDVNEDVKGTIMVYPLNIDIAIDFSQNIEKKYTIKYDKELEPLIFSVSNLNKDKFVLFDYEYEFKNDQGEIINLSNPFEICTGEICENNITNYTFLKGVQYTIRIKFEKKIVNIDGFNTSYYFLPAFSFYEGEIIPNERDTTEKNRNKDKVKKILLIVVPFVLVLVIIAVLFIFIYKKNVNLKEEVLKTSFKEIE